MSESCNREGDGEQHKISRSKSEGQQTHRPPSPGPSFVSMKSDWSKGADPNFGHEPVSSYLNRQTHRPPSPEPSFVSMKSDWSKGADPNFGHEPVLSQLKSVDSALPPLLDDEHTVTRSRKTQDEVLRRVIRNHKERLKRSFESISEGIIKPGAETLLNEIYTELYITEGESEGVNKEHEVWQVEFASRTQTTEDTPINCNDIFKSLPGQDKHIRTVMTKGVAGIGKTVSVQKFILDWADGIANNDIDFMFPLPFRELNLVRNDQYSLHKLLLDFYPELKDLRDGEEYKDCRVVFIFDGLDESRLTFNIQCNVMSDIKQSSSVDVLMTSLIYGTLFSGALIWITSRPAAASQIPAQCINLVTEVRGFSDPQKEEYFRKRISDESQANRIISHIKASRSLHIMCHVPVFCWITATVLQQMLTNQSTKHIPKTLTEMFIHFLLIQTTRKDQKYQGGQDTEIHSLLESQRTMILKLAELAFKNLDIGNLMFYEEDLRECGIDVREASVYSGMCTEIFKEESVFRQRKVYCFVHLSIQEFLAAMFVFQAYVTENRQPLESLLNEEYRQEPNPSMLSTVQACLGLQPQSQDNMHVLLKSAVDEALKSRNGHLDLFLRFLMGISLENNQRLLQGLLNQIYHTSKSIRDTCQYIKDLNREGASPERCINLFQCLLEMNDHSMYNEVQKYLTSLKKSQKLSPAHCSALAHMILMSEEEIDVFDMKKYNTTFEGHRRLIPAVRCFKTAKLGGYILSGKTCEIVARVLQSPNSLKELDFSDCELTDSGVELLCPGLSSPHCKQEKLSLPGCLLSERSCHFLASCLTSNPSHLRHLDMSFNHPGETGLALLWEKVNDPECKLEKLNTDHCADIRLRTGVRKYACELTLDPNTAFKSLSLFAGGKMATYLRMKQPYPNHPDRFAWSCQVLCREALSGRCYWEAEWCGYGVGIAVAYKSINRKLPFASNLLGRNYKSWSLECHPNRYTVRHGIERVDMPVLHAHINRIGVYLDWTAGILSFYRVCPDGLILLYKFHSKFTQPLYPGFRLWSYNSSVSLIY